MLILLISVFTALLGEGLTWLLVYRTDQYQKLKVEIERQTKKLEKKKEAHGENVLDRTQKRKMDREEERLKSTNRDMVRFNWAVGIQKCISMKLLFYLKSNQFYWFVIIDVSCLC